jgi:hypothetical protein
MISNLNLDSLSGLSDRSNFKLADSEAIELELRGGPFNLKLV